MTLIKYCGYCECQTHHDVNGIGMEICQECRRDNTEPNMKSKTPRTDNLNNEVPKPMPLAYGGMLGHARNLELELFAATTANSILRAAMYDIQEHDNASPKPRTSARIAEKALAESALNGQGRIAEPSNIQTK